MEGKNINVLYLVDEINYDELGGSERQFMALHKEIKRSDINPFIFFLRSSDVANSTVWKNKPGVIDFKSFKSLSSWKGLGRIFSCIRKNRIKLVHTLLIDSTLLGAVIKIIKPSIKVISCQRNMGYLHTGILKKLISISYRLSSAVIVNSTMIRHELINSYGVNKKSITVINNIFEEREPDINYSDNEFIQLRKKHKFIAIIVSNPKRIKGFYELIDAAKDIKGAVDIAFVILGAGAGYDDALLTVKNNNLCDSVYLPGFKTEIGYYLKHADLAILPSLSEGFSNALIEYIYYGVPTIATNVGGNSEALADGLYGLLIPPGSAKEISAAIIKLLNNYNEYDLAARRGMDESKQKYTAEACLHKHHLLYNRVINE